MTDLLRAELVRDALLQFLAARPALSFDIESLIARLNQSRMLDFPVLLEDLQSAIAFLEDKNLVKHAVHGLGSTRFYQVTSAGVLAFERGTIEETK